MSFSTELFQMHDFVTDLPLLSSSRCQPPYAMDDLCFNTTATALEHDGQEFANNLFPFIDSQPLIATMEQYSCFFAQGYCPVPVGAHYLDRSLVEQDFILKASNVATEEQPIPMVGTPDLCSVYTNSYSPSLALNEFCSFENFALPLSEHKKHQEEYAASLYKLQPQDFLIVSPLPQFDDMHSPASYNFTAMEKYSCYNNTAPPVQSSRNSVCNNDAVIDTQHNNGTTTSVITTHRPRYDCSKCDKDFSRPQDLNRHYQSRHTDQKKYRCKCCNRPFARKDALKRHEKSKKFDCQKRTRRTSRK